MFFFLLCFLSRVESEGVIYHSKKSDIIDDLEKEISKTWDNLIIPVDQSPAYMIALLRMIEYSSTHWFLVVEFQPSKATDNCVSKSTFRLS